MKILGIETSCDECAASLIAIHDLRLAILSNVVSSQIDIHKKYGGIVPEVAARQHVQTMIPVIQEALDLSQKPSIESRVLKPDLIAVTQGPGLITSLQVGLQTAKTLSYVWGVPLVGVNHLEAHLWSFLLNQENKETKKQENKFPAIGLIVSGGHTELVLVKKVGKYKSIGRTRDDAVGEAFDKVAKLLGLGFPGGPIISHYAKNGDSEKINFPRPMIESDDFDFSFSGIKTAVKYHLQNMISTGLLSQRMINDICASFQKAVVDVLVSKTIRAVRQYKAKSVILGGGVSANECLIEDLRLKTKDLGVEFYYPSKEFTQDNAAMVALVGYFKQKNASKKNWQKLTAEPNLKLID